MITANINKTYFKLDENGHEAFCKLVPKLNSTIFDFQNLLGDSITGKFNINKYLYTNVKPGFENSFELVFEKIENKQWDINPNSMHIIGKSMSILHGAANVNRNEIHIPIKNEKYDSMEKWDVMPNTTQSQRAYKRRREIFRQLESFNLSQPKIPLHRDFKPHNILFDGNSFHLIDFDFAAVDYTCLEIMAFIVDIRGEDNIKAFIDAYKSISNNGVNFNTMVNDYLVYLCTNTFPFYMKDSLDNTGFMNLLNHRNSVLEYLWNNKDMINKLVKDENN